MGQKLQKKKKKNLILRSDYAVINFGIIPPIFGQILKCSLMTKWYQLESMSGHANKSGTAKKLQLYATSIFTFLSTRLTSIAVGFDTLKRVFKKKKKPYKSNDAIILPLSTI